MTVRRTVLAAVAALLFVCPAFAASPNVVISQVYGGGGASTGTPTYKNDYVELFNTSTAPVTLTGYSVQYGSSTGNFSSVYAIPSGTTIAAGGYLFLQVSSAGTAGGAFPVTPDLTTTALNMAAGSGKVALANISTALGCGATATVCSLPDSRIVDLVSYGASNDAEGGATAGNGSAITNAQAAVRASGGCQDTDNNNADFAIVTGPVPRNSSSPKNPCGTPTNNPPTITAPADPITTVTQDAAAFAVSLTGSDDNSKYSWSATAGTGVSGVTVSSGQGTATAQFTVTLTAGFHGTASFTATLTDDASQTANQTVHIQVNSPATDNPPTITAPTDPITTVTKNAAPFDVMLSGSDDHSVYTWSATAGTGLSSVTVSNGTTNTATFHVTLATDFVGTATFTASLSDGVNTAVTQQVNITVNPPAVPAGEIVISQFYGGGHNSGSTYNNDYIELFNRTGAAVSVEGWAVQAYSFGASAWAATPLHGTIQPYSYHLVQEAQGSTVGGGTTPLPSPDATDTNDVGSTAGRIALTSTATVLPDPCSTRADILDFVGYSSKTDDASCTHRTTIPTSLSNTLAGFRTLGGCTFNNNNADWSIAPPSPRNSSSPVNDCSTHPQAIQHVMISQVYGGGGNSGATYANDFVELYNPLDTDVSLDGWSIQYASTTGNGWGGENQPLGGTIKSHDYFLIELSTGTTGEGQSVNGANVIGTINMAAGAGKVALVKRYGSLTGNCPIGDLDLVDFVGYGTGTDCFEGGAPAPGLSNTQADDRVSKTDTDQNSVDFTKQAPSPNAGPGGLVPLPPNVTNVEPSATNAPYDATVRVDFGEAVTVADGWYSINCTTSGDHTGKGTLASAFEDKTWLFTPNLDATFTPGETCTVNVFADKVTNEDPDAPSDTQHPLNDYTFNFTVATGAAAPYPPEVHLTMGNPSNAIDDVTVPNNYLMMKPTYALSYNRDKGTPNWVSWHLDASWYGSLARVDVFRADPKVIPDWYRVEETDFTSSGFDRGHMCPNADRDNQNRIPINQETYLMSNMVPQAPDNNQGPWANLEAYLRTQTDAGKEIYIISGPAGVGGTGSNGGVTTTLAHGHITVPAYTWKVALVLTDLDGDDVKRVDASTRTIAVLMPNVQGIRTSNSNDWQTYLTTVDAIQQLTGYDFFSNVPKIVQNSIERGVNGTNPPGVADETATTAEDQAVSVAIDAVSPDSAAVYTYTIDNAPAHGTLSGSGPNFTYTPTQDYNGVDSFRFHVNDGHADSNVATATINITPVNDPPVLTGVPATATIPELAAYGFTASATDVDHDTLTFSLVDGPAGASIDASTGAFSWTPSEAQGPGTYPFQVSVSDGTTSVTASITLTVSEVNATPAIAPIGSLNAHVGTPLAFTASASDSDIPAQTLSYQLSSTVPVGASINSATGAFTWTPDSLEAGQTYTFDVVVSDGVTSASASVTATVVTGDFAPVVSTLHLSTYKLAPANHKLVDVTALYTVSDIGDSAPQCTLEVSSSDSESGAGRFAMGPDWQILDAHHLRLRAEHAPGNGERTYTIRSVCTDRFSNVGRSPDAFVTVH